MCEKLEGASLILPGMGLCAGDVWHHRISLVGGLGESHCCEAISLVSNVVLLDRLTS